MLTGLIILHVIICILLTIVVLLQFGKGAEAGAMMGQGSSQAIFTSSAKGNFFTKMTTVLAILFMVNSIALTTIKSKSAQESVFDDEAPQVAPLNSDAQAPATDATAQPAQATNTSETKEVAKPEAAQENKAEAPEKK
jgi:preprotein translocase subunit SecG